jgi:8-oxo-dGTP pyrophosphatase MutT (NUDIX family)
MSSAARPASTVVLIRPAAGAFEVLLVKRHDNVAFMGGAHVFPGGRVDAADRLDAPERICDGVAEAAARMPDLEPDAAVAHHVAGIRELFEEAGVLLAGPSAPSRLDRLRQAMIGGSGLPALAQSEGFRLALDSLLYFAHWVTPEIEIKRFDARFFLAVLPEGQQPAHDAHETTEVVWMPPAVAVECCRRDEILLPPPTWITLRALSEFGSVDEVTQWARRQTVVRIQPDFFREGDTAILTLPGDPASRFILDGGRWRPAK